MPPFVQHRTLRILLSMVIPICGAVFQYHLWDILKPTIWIFLYPSVFLSAAVGGLVGGLLATLIAVALADFLFIPPSFTFYIAETRSIYSMCIFFSMGILFSIVFEQLHRSLLAVKRLSSFEVNSYSQRLDQALSVADAGIWEWHVPSGEVFWSESLWRLYGLKKNSCQASYDNWLSTIAEEDRATTHEAMDQALKQKADVLLEWRVHSKLDGHTHYLLSRGQPLLDEHGELLLYRGVVIDITDRKQSEHVLQQLTQELEDKVEARTKEFFDLYNQAPCGYHSLSPEGTILRVNQTELDLLGYTSDEYLGHPITEFMTPDSRKLFESHFPEFMRTGHVRDLEFDFFCKDGSIRPFLVNADLIRNAQGEAQYSTSTLVDDRERKAREQKLQDLNKFLNEVLEVLPFGVVVYDESYKAVFRNSLFGKLLSYPSELCKKEPLYFADAIRFNFDRGDYPNRTFDDVLNGFIDMMAARETVCFERQQANGIYLEICGQPISNGWTLLTYTDITPHRLAEQSLETARGAAEAATRAKSAFLANMSHEIRTPMNAILGLAYLLEKSELPGDANHLVSKIRMAGRSLLGIINDILDFSKIESDKLEIEHAPFRLGDVLDNLSTIMSTNAGEKELELIIAQPPSKTKQLYGDALRLEQVLINLTSNAIKFTEQGHVELAIAVTAEDDQQITLRFAVRDTGIGIPADIQQDIFSPFSQADSSTSRRFGGTGLGLSICRRLIAAMGGELQVTSIPGSGSEFWFNLTFKRGQDVWLAAPDMANLPVLVAHGNPIAREVLADIVAGLGWNATAVGSGSAALQHIQSRLLAREPNQVLLLDYKTPGMDGFTVANKIRNELKDHHDPIIIMVTAHASNALQTHSDMRHVDALLTKPVTASALYNTVARALRVRQGGEPLRPKHAQQRLAGLRILVVDDSDINREVAQRILEGEGAHVELAHHGRQALEWLEAHENGIDIVLMDVQMPIMNGYEATQRIRRMPALADLPIVALTAGAFMEQQELAQAAGMTGFIAKPFDVDAAIALIIKLTGGTRQIAPMYKPHLAIQPNTSDLELPSLDVERGLKLFPDVSTYQQYLRKFARDYADSLHTIKFADTAEARAFLHKLKGVATTLALLELGKQAAEVEQQLVRGAEITGPLRILKSALDKALDSIAEYAPDKHVVDNTQAKTIDRQQLTALLAQMLAILANDDMVEFRPLLLELDKTVGPTSLEPLNRAIENYDFRTAEAEVRTLAAEHSITL
ncbi:response regulator [Methylomonas sp. BW4-1]|uniref:response regulator n=1 Tax=Methylomonas sp. BW4-1 TaxID=3376685 RepID=UPI0040429E73